MVTLVGVNRNISLLLTEVRLVDCRDKMIWALENNKTFTMKSLYRSLTFGGVVDSAMSDIWKCKIPLKVQIFLWMAFQDRIQSAVQLKKRKWAGDPDCKLCR